MAQRQPCKAARQSAFRSYNERTETPVFKRTRVRLFGPHQSSYELSHLPKRSGLSEETNSGPFEADQTRTVWKRKLQLLNSCFISHDGMGRAVIVVYCFTRVISEGAMLCNASVYWTNQNPSSYTSPSEPQGKLSVSVTSRRRTPERLHVRRTVWLGNGVWQLSCLWGRLASERMQVCWQCTCRYG